MARQDRFQRAEAALRQQALSYPETHEDFPWGHRAIKVKGKAFLFMATCQNKDYVFSLTVKLPQSGKTALDLPFASPTGYHLGKAGWVTACFGAKDVIPLEMLSDWVAESFRAIAPKRVLAKFESNDNQDSVATAAAPATPNVKPKKLRARKTGRGGQA
jgi:predicted DNA-binding protein (MmcQ/YjbR family)